MHVLVFYTLFMSRIQQTSDSSDFIAKILKIKSKNEERITVGPINSHAGLNVQKPEPVYLKKMLSSPFLACWRRLSTQAS